MPLRKPTKRTAILLLAAVASFAVVAVVLYLRTDNSVTIGVEGRHTVTLPLAELQAIPYTHGDAVALRIASVTPIPGEPIRYRYDLRYMAYGPGEHDLSQYLIDSAGQRPAELPAMPVAVNALLPDDYSGKLFDTPAMPIDLNSNYRLAMGLLWALWAALLIPLMMLGRKRRQTVVAAPPPPSVPERLQELLQLAQREPLTVHQQADLEKLLMAFWAERLGVHTNRLADTLEQLRQHPAAAAQVRLVEKWLHARVPENGNGAPPYGNGTPQNGNGAAPNSKVARELLQELGWLATGRGQEVRA